MLNPRALVSSILAVLLVMLVAASSAFALSAATRTWVSGVGDDVNPCSRTAPCKTFAGAISKTNDAGEIDALDPGGFGAVTITRSMTIDGAGTLAGVLVSGGTNGIVINGAGIDVVIRNISIKSAATSPEPTTGCKANGLAGVRIVNARSVRLDHVSISTLSGAAVSVAATVGADAFVSLHDVDVTDACGGGVDASASSNAQVLVDHSTITHGGTAVRAGAGVAATVSSSTFFGNAAAVDAHDGGTIADAGGNVLVANGATPGAFSSSVPGPPTAAPTPITVNPTPVTVTPTPPVVTTVTTPVPLVVALALSSLGGAPGKPVTLAYAATAAGVAELEVRKGGSVVAQANGVAHKGSNAIAWNGKVAGKAAAPGVYALTLRVRGADGQEATAQATAKLVKPVAAKVLVTRRVR